ncbi:MAG: hypothetical protein D6690_16205 [Nitrospirae bacterium]|nr:MAG: hypothetical protein D6690_16205 [Nitrospirota bacterium]
MPLSGLFADERTEPLYGIALGGWSRNDFTQASRWSKACRRAASKRRDKVVSDNLSKAIKVINQTAKPPRRSNDTVGRSTGRRLSRKRTSLEITYCDFGVGAANARWRKHCIRIEALFA